MSDISESLLGRCRHSPYNRYPVKWLCRAVPLKLTRIDVVIPALPNDGIPNMCHVYKASSSPRPMLVFGADVTMVEAVPMAGFSAVRRLPLRNPDMS
jgi:hypothetical protein